jgi:dipeptidyl aminopeptidase/acylaminoacyl peptidase
MTADGRTVVFATAATNLTATKTALGALLARDTQAGTTTVAATDTRGAPLRVAGNERTAILALSPDGRYLLFFTEPSKISANPSSKRQVILADRTTGRLELVSVSSRGVAGDHTAGLFGASISADGRRVLFTSNSSNLAPGGRSGRYALFLRTRG